MANGPEENEVEGKKSCRGCRVMEDEEENRKQLLDDLASSKRTSREENSEWFPITTNQSFMPRISATLTSPRVSVPGLGLGGSVSFENRGSRG